ncbi:outer dynein arm-docking complex subunit 3 [Athalia rosae]|uniref:outer dynein arm-docking complex subunit 3 n=1 Tax=Athalia rosae TaxID=37344 RepID=UPI002033E8DF|nr:outer dynein arm-docking complex subunit 3 [Athalia rosae]
MSDPLVQSAKESRLNALNKKIIEIKKKIQLSEGQRKACFEECDAQKKENADKVCRLKKEVKELQLTFAKAKNHQNAADSELLRGQEVLSSVKRKNLEDSISGLDEDIIRLRKKLDLVRYESDKQQKKLTGLLQDYEELMSGDVQKMSEKKLENPLKKKIIKLENQLQRIHVMQMEADTVRKKYRGVRSSLKADAALYASSLRTLEDNIQEQKMEINRLQDVKKEAIHLRDITKGTLMKQEVEAMNTSKQRDGVILDYRQRVEDRKLELERLERMIFPTCRPIRRDEGESDEQTTTSPSASKEGTQHLEEAFAKLREATGVSRTEDVLNRFLAQKATKDKLQKMRMATENEKINLEKTRQQLMAAIEMQKFSETKESEQNAEELDNLNRQILEQIQREEKALADNKRVKELLTEVNATLWHFCDRLRDISDTPIPEKVGNVEEIFKLLEVLQEKVGATIELAGSVEKDDAEITEDSITAEKLETTSTTEPSAVRKIKDTDDRPFFPTFPSAPTPAAPAPPSEDEEEVPTRSILKRQAQLLVDTKSRRKGFNFRR